MLSLATLFQTKHFTCTLKAAVRCRYRQRTAAGGSRFHTDRQTDRQTDKQTGRQAYGIGTLSNCPIPTFNTNITNYFYFVQIILKESGTVHIWWKNKLKRHRQTDRQTDRQAGRQAYSIGILSNCPVPTFHTNITNYFYFIQIILKESGTVHIWWKDKLKRWVSWPLTFLKNFDFVPFMGLFCVCVFPLFLRLCAILEGPTVSWCVRNEFCCVSCLNTAQVLLPQTILPVDSRCVPSTSLSGRHDPP